jgi:predicted HNH restriction endonuclease
MKKDYCRKCGKYGSVQEHHILPQSTFGKNNEKINLCPNCHADYHEQLGRNNLSNTSMEFHFEKFFKWISGLSIIVALIYYLAA